MPVDLHIHTTASDGTAAPSSVVRSALDAHLSTIAITDHDSVQGVDAALNAARGTTLSVLPGVELSATTDGEHDVHILGFLVRHGDTALLAALEDLRVRRLERAREMVDALAAAGYDVTIEGVLAHAGAGAIGRSHIARALVDAGLVESVEQAFLELIGRQGRFFIQKRLLSAIEAIALIRAAGGVAILAHPGVTRCDEVIPDLVEAGLGGLEAYHAEHSQSDRDHYANLAARLDLVATGGSDYHGPHTKSGSLGAGRCPDSAVAALSQRAASVRR